MIVVSKLNKERFAVNPDLIQRIDSAPDTILTLVDGTKYIVRESMLEVIDLITNQRASVIARAQSVNNGIELDPGAQRGKLSLVTKDLEGGN